ncbi:MAG TPA: dCTP deaminase [Chloroflexota bacterium]|nr:dCTP deaminase [Chloroflexota bacterium]
MVNFSRANPVNFSREIDTAPPLRTSREHYVPFGEYFVLHPRHFVLGSTLEYVRLPPEMGAYAVGRSTWGRLGLVIATAIGIQPGFVGTITLELANEGEVPMKLYPGVSIAQLFFHNVSEPGDSGASSQFLGAVGPGHGTLAKDRVLTKLQDLLDQRRATTSAGAPVSSESMAVLD